MRGKRILIANRGEIALRVMRAAREMGHIPLAVYSTADRLSLHVTKAAEAMCVGEGPSPQSYLNIDNILKAAKQMRADAIHPGYGFLSENAKFAKRVQEEGFLFVGPSAESIQKMGDKVMARKTMASVGLPLVPGSPDGLTDEVRALELAKEIGFPIMIKAVAGGGGRGMRIVPDISEFSNLFKRASSEAEKAFGDGRLYLERYVSSPHHIEVQILADTHGNVCHLFERECSVQRRHQKVIEETPSPFLSEQTRKKLCDAAVKAIRELGYVNAGTLEFLVDENQNFYFMEMNTRLQVEHPVTEWVTGMDLVKEQLRIAFGEPISFKQEELKSRGHAMEFRVCAEDPEKFLPQAGLVRGVQFPLGPWVRLDSHLYRGYEIPVFYDSMVAKLSVWGRTRAEAIERGRAALQDMEVVGVKTNIPLHLQILDNPRFQEGHYTTRFIGEDFHYREAVPSEHEAQLGMIAAAVAAFAKEYGHQTRNQQEDPLWRSRARWEGLR